MHRSHPRRPAELRSTMAMDRTFVSMILSPQFWRMSLLWTAALVASHLRLLFLSSRHFPRRRPALLRPLCIVTGATSGLGAATAMELASEGFHVLLVGRNAQLLSKTIQDIKQQHKDAWLDAFQVDLSSISSIVKFENSLKQWLLDSGLHPSVQLLVNNAGILATSCRSTADGCDEMMETNYIGAFVMSNLLLPLLKNSPVPSRIVNVTSFTHRCLYDIKVGDDILDRNNLRFLSTLSEYPFARTYELSKLCMLLFSYELHRQLYLGDPSSTVSVTSADPGAVETNIMREIPSCLSQLAFIVLRILGLLQSAVKGAGAVIDAALAPPDASGEYFFGGKGRTMSSSALSYNAMLATKLWSSSFMLLRRSTTLAACETLKA